MRDRFHLIRSFGLFQGFFLRLWQGRNDADSSFRAASYLDTDTCSGEDFEKLLNMLTSAFCFAVI